METKNTTSSQLIQELRDLSVVYAFPMIPQNDENEVVVRNKILSVIERMVENIGEQYGVSFVVDGVPEDVPENVTNFKKKD